MSETVRHALITGEQLLAMGDIGPCELIDGEIVAMSPTGFLHGDVELQLARLLADYVDANDLGRVATGEVGIYIARDPDRIRAADVAFVPKANLPPSPRSFLEIAPELVVEVISPNDRWQDTRAKILDYFTIGVHRVWLVEPAQRAVLVYAEADSYQRFDQGDVIPCDGTLTGLEIQVADIFPAQA